MSLLDWPSGSAAQHAQHALAGGPEKSLIPAGPSFLYPFLRQLFFSWDRRQAVWPSGRQTPETGQSCLRRSVCRFTGRSSGHARHEHRIHSFRVPSYPAIPASLSCIDLPADFRASEGTPDCASVLGFVYPL